LFWQKRGAVLLARSPLHRERGRFRMCKMSTPVIVWLLVAAKLLFHLLIANRYGIFRDELYYLACAERAKV
jgi:hypothetical protein